MLWVFFIILMSISWSFRWVFVHNCAEYSFNSIILVSNSVFVILLCAGNIKQIQFIIHTGWEQVWSAKRTQVQNSTWQTSTVLYKHSYINTSMFKTLYKWISIWSLINTFIVHDKSQNFCRYLAANDGDWLERDFPKDVIPVCGKGQQELWRNVDMA